jgi:hypothetical protein
MSVLTTYLEMYKNGISGHRWILGIPKRNIDLDWPTFSAGCHFCVPAAQLTFDILLNSI